MRIGIDAHILLKKHKRYDEKIARYTEDLIKHLIAADTKKEHTWVLFFDSRAKNTKTFEADNVEIYHFPFIQYRKYLPVVYTHMLVSAFLRRARIDVFHSPEGLIPFVYPGKIITTFHYVPKGETESNLFVRTFMLGARAAFAQLCRRAKRIIVGREEDKKCLIEKHGCPEDRIVLMPVQDLTEEDWKACIPRLMELYKEVVEETRAKASTKKEDKQEE